MIEIIAWVAVVVIQAVVHFLLLPKQRRELEEDAKAEAEMLERLRASNQCDDSNSVVFGESDASDDACFSRLPLPGRGAHGDCYPGRSLRISESNSTIETDPAADDNNSCSSVGEDEDLDCIDDGLEQSRLKLLRYYYSPSSPDMFQMEPFRSSCGSISSLDESEDPERVRVRKPATCTSAKSLEQPRLDQRTATSQQPPVPNGVLRRRNIQSNENRKDANVGKHVGFARHSSPVVQCA